MRLDRLSALEPGINHHSNSERELDASDYILLITLCRPDRMKYTCEGENSDLVGCVSGGTADMIIWKIASLLKQDSRGDTSPCLV
jgi:hypothetical protein